MLLCMIHVTVCGSSCQTCPTSIEHTKMTGARLYQPLTQVLKGSPFNSKHALVTGITVSSKQSYLHTTFQLGCTLQQFMYIPEKGRKPPKGATEAELCTPVLGLDASTRSNKAVFNPSLSILGPPRGDKRSVAEASLFLNIILTSSLGRETSIVN